MRNLSIIFTTSKLIQCAGVDSRKPKDPHSFSLYLGDQGQALSH